MSTATIEQLQRIVADDTRTAEERRQAAEHMGKRTTSVTVKMSAADYELLTKAAETIWPGALLTNSSIVLGLAKIGAEAVLKGKKAK